MLQEYNIKSLKENPFKMIGEEWMLIAAGDKEEHNMMTASWGGLGVLWGKNVATVYIRPSRYTLEFVEYQDYFSLCFFGKDNKVHSICGTKSGRKIDKTKACNLTPCYDQKAVYFAEAELVFICRKIYESQIDAHNFLDEGIHTCYKEGDFHKVFIGEIVATLKSDRRI
ncbi:MAG: flavin reductase family protein [Clostridiales bacterium]|nr:flavin reductase family protein [Clostridiales bacterium]